MHVQLFEYNYEFFFTMKKRKIPPTFQLYMKNLKHRIQIEKLIAINSDKIETQSKNYEILKNIFHGY